MSNMADKKSDSSTKKNPISKLINNIKQGQQKSAQEALLEDLFNNMYAQRKKVYKMNFFRGIFFAVGSIIGGTIVIALIIWLLSLFVNLPVIGDYFKDAQHSIQNSNPKN